MLAVGLYLGLATPRRRAGAFLTLLGIATAWARVYAGVHFPLDILGSLGVGPGSAGLVDLYGRALAPWIRRGWVRGVTGP